MYRMECVPRRPDTRTAGTLTRKGAMRTNGLASPEAEARAQKEDDHQRWADDGGSPPDDTRRGPPADAPVAESPLPVRLVYRRRPAA